MMPARIFPFMTDYQLSAVPLFIFMAAMLEKAGIIEELFDVIYKWLGSVKGGLASATVIACTALAAMVGVVGATEVIMGMIALPAMLKRGYEPKLRSEEHTSELQSLMRISYAGFSMHKQNSQKCTSR